MSCSGCSKLLREVAALKEEMDELRALLPGAPPPVPRLMAARESPKVEAPRRRRDDWQMPKKGVPLRPVKEPAALELRNSFAALSEIAEAKDTLPEVLMVGDSMLRDQGSIFGRKCKKRATVYCYPGAGIQHIASNLPKIQSPIQATVISVGTNDVGSDSIAQIRIKYRALLSKLSERRSPSILMGILPRMSVNADWNEKARNINRWLHVHCNERGITFVNLWDQFIGSKYLFRNDGVHLTHRGKELVSETLGEILSEDAIFVPFLS